MLYFTTESKLRRVIIVDTGRSSGNVGRKFEPLHSKVKVKQRLDIRVYVFVTVIVIPGWRLIHANAKRSGETSHQELSVQPLE